MPGSEVVIVYRISDANEGMVDVICTVSEQGASWEVDAPTGTLSLPIDAQTAAALVSRETPIQIRVS